ncbi:hypothetical protein [Nannocystis pusilla]|uniref:hypothetical protein n=1 Tax=Nannocystis pusilla TaxID=889268 RepID=UPI003B7883D5
MRALYKHVITSTRYVGLEFGIHGFKPYRTTDVYDRRFGDCKDKASLLKVMLAEAGIASHLVLVRTRDQGTLGATPASLSAFNHAITYVPSLDLWLDGTAEFSGPEELPTGDQGATVLVVRDGKGAEFKTIPVSQPGDNKQIVHQTVELKPDGSADVKHLFTVTGASAASWRSALQAAENRKERLTQVWGGQFPGLEIRELEAPNIGDVLHPVQLRSAWSVPAWAQRQGDVLRFNVLGHRTGLQRGLAGQAAREHDLVMAAPATEVNVIEVTAPKGYTFGQSPAGKSFETPFARFTLDVAGRGDRVEVRTELEYRTHRFKAADYRALREFLGQVDGALEQAFELRPEPRGRTDMSRSTLPLHPVRSRMFLRAALVATALLSAAAPACKPREGTSEPHTEDSARARLKALEARLKSHPDDDAAWREAAHLHWLFLKQPDKARPILDRLAAKGDPVAQASRMIFADARLDLKTTRSMAQALIVGATTPGGDAEARRVQAGLAELAARLLGENHGELPDDDDDFVRFYDKLAKGRLPVEVVQPLVSLRAQIARRLDQPYLQYYDQQGCVRAFAVGPVEGSLEALELRAAAKDMSSGTDKFKADPTAVLTPLACAVRTWNLTPRGG